MEQFNVDRRINVTVRTQYLPDGSVEQLVLSDRDVLAREVASFKEQGIRDILQKLGWSPPGGLCWCLQKTGED